MHAGVAVPLAAVLGLLAAGLLIWRREHRIRHSSMRSTLAGLTLRGSESIPSTSQDLKLELGGKGEPLLLGQGSFGRVRHKSLRPSLPCLLQELLPPPLWCDICKICARATPGVPPSG